MTWIPIPFHRQIRELRSSVQSIENSSDMHNFEGPCDSGENVSRNSTFIDVDATSAVVAPTTLLTILLVTEPFPTSTAVVVSLPPTVATSTGTSPTETSLPTEGDEKPISVCLVVSHKRARRYLLSHCHWTFHRTAQSPLARRKMEMVTILRVPLPWITKGAS
jgi:hypothetical protein